MSKKQTSNTFGKGLVQDLHPLIVPNDTLTDALNATTVTMNGNEGILQNDMGNGRVESAFLPPGYVPVGIKEYGGIIYVASYNPITNKSQIGSFPSPERNIDQTESGLTNPLQLLNNTYIRTYKFSKFNNSSFTNGLGQLTNKVEIFGDYKVIRSGDKFGFYFGEYNQNNHINHKSILSNYFNYSFPNRGTNKSYSYNPNNFNQYGGWDPENGVYQNNIISLSVEVLDNNNNLRDITYQLKRYDDNTVIKYDSDQVTESDIFNAGYFIGDTANSSWNSVDVERNKKALNTYNNKLFGKLYLVGKVNVIDHIEVSIQPASGKKCNMFPQYQGQCQEDSKNLLFYIDYYYNCPYNYLEKPSINYYYLHFDTIDPDHAPNIKNIISSCISEIGTPVYDVYTNLYRQRYAAFIELSAVDNGDPIFPINIENTVLNFIVVPQMKNIPGENPITPGGTPISKLTHIATEGSIDLSKIGSGTANIIRWRYLCMGSYMYLNWGLEDYPLESDIITDFRMEFYNLNSSSNDPDYVQYFNKTSYNGSFTETINFSENTIKPRQIYIVKIIRRKNDTEQEIGERIIITTDIYNHLFLKYDDFFPEVSGGTSETLEDIQAANEIKINFNVSEKSYIKGKTSYDKKLLHIREENVSNNQITYTYTLSNDNIKSFSFNPDKHVYVYTEFSSFRTSNTIDINLSLSEKYPFELDNVDKVEYEIYQSDPTIEDNERETRFGNEDIPIFEDGNVLNLSSDYDKFKLSNDSNNPTDRITGNSSTLLLTEYNFPAEAIIAYDERPTQISITSEYITLYEYARNELINKNILVPWVMVREVTGDDYVRYMLLKCVPGTGAISKIKEHTAIRELKRNGGLGSFYIDENISEIYDHLDASGLSNGTFCLVGSPSLFGLGRNNTYQGIINEVCESTKYDNDDVKGNYFLRPVLRQNESGDERFLETDNTGKQLAGYKAWFYLLWKDVNGKFVILDLVYRDTAFFNNNGVSGSDNNANIVNNITPISVETAIKMLFNKENASLTNGFSDRLFFKTNVYGKLKDIYKVNGIAYTRDYNVQISDNININNIQLVYGTGNTIDDLLKYYEGNDVTIKKSNGNDIIECVNSNSNNPLYAYLIFKVSLQAPSSINTTVRSYKINGMEDFINQINQSGELGGFINFNNNIYTSDSNGNNLNEDIYLFEEVSQNNYELRPKSLVEEEQVDLVKRLTVYNNNLLLESSLKGKSEKYARSATNNSKIVARLGKSLSYVPFYKTGYSNIQNYDTLIQS